MPAKSLKEGSECFDRLSMNGKNSNDVDESAIVPSGELATNSERRRRTLASRQR
jgi:hypothetical protein